LFQDILNGVQKDLFVIQAEVAGAPKTITPEKVARMEQVIDSIEQELPPIKSFVIPGGSAASALLDFTRTVARRTEREVLEATLKGEATISEHTKSFLNRLSSLLYALARLANWKLGLREEAPDYQ
jgi:cob(I)alamin adenosyltransferase